MSLPEYFVWTKFGVESGESSSSILERKEKERNASDGVFLWGIGNSIFSSVIALGKLVQLPVVPVIFTPMLSKPQEIDCFPSTTVQWKKAYGLDGVEWEMPPKSLVVSRLTKRHYHYALVCYKPDTIAIDPNPVKFSVDNVVNFVSGHPVGYSQVTSVVKRTGYNPSGGYVVAFKANLIYPFVVMFKDFEVL